MSIFRRSCGIQRFFCSRSNQHIFPLGDIELTYGGKLPNAKLAYATYGKLNSAKNNAILFPTCYSGVQLDNSWMIGKDRALDPSKYFIIVPSLFGNGESSSPSNTPDPHDKDRFPKISIEDNLYAQHCLAEHFGITKFKLTLGRNVGSHIASLWLTCYPDMVEQCATFGRQVHKNNYDISCFDAAKQAMISHKGFTSKDGVRRSCIRTFSRVFTEWGLARAFYKEELYEQLGFKSRDAFNGMWENYFVKKDPYDLLCMLWTWKRGIVNAPPLSDVVLKQIQIIPMGPSFLTCPFGDNSCNPSQVEKLKYSYFVPMPFRQWIDRHENSELHLKMVDKQLKKILEAD